MPSTVIRMCLISVTVIVLYQRVTRCPVSSSVRLHTGLLFPAAASASCWHRAAMMTAAAAMAMLMMEVNGRQSQAPRAAGRDASSGRRAKSDPRKKRERARAREREGETGVRLGHGAHALRNLQLWPGRDARSPGSDSLMDEHLSVGH